MTTIASDDYDSPWKEALERYLPEFLALLFPHAHAGIDWSQGYAFLDKELQQVVRDAALGRRLADKLFRFIDWMLRLPEELEEQLWSEIQTFETVEHMPYVTSVERIGIRKGIQEGIQQGIQQATREGLQRQRHMLTRQVQRQFGADVAQESGPVLARIDDPQRLDDLAEAVLDSADGEAWLSALRRVADDDRA